MFMINNCTFDYNKGDSIVYFNHFSTSQSYLCIKNSKLNKNREVPVYILNQQLFIKGLVLFAENSATDGAELL